MAIHQLFLGITSAVQRDALLDAYSTTFGAFGDKTRYVKEGGPTDGNRQKWTFSCWFKRQTFTSGSVQVIFSNGSGSNGEGFIGFTADDKLYIGNDGHHNFVNTGRRFRDTGWTHLVWAADSTQATNDNRWKIYINGELVPASDYGSPSITQNGSGYIGHYGPNENMDVCVGERLRHHFNSANYSAPFKGQMAQVYFIDGQQLAPTEFAETKDGVYKPVLYGMPANNTPNDGRVWSDYLSVSTNGIFQCGTNSKTYAFNGKTEDYSKSARPTDSSKDIVFNVPKDLQENITSLKIYVYGDQVTGNGGFWINGSNATTNYSNVGGASTWVTYSNLPSRIYNFSFGQRNAGRSTALSAVEINGHILIDNHLGGHSFHLPLDGSDSPGWSRYGLGGSAIVSKATGGLPIFNTVNEGKVIAPGFTKDYGTNTPDWLKKSGCTGFNGTSNWLRVPQGGDFDFGTGDFTVEAWVFVKKWQDQHGNAPRGMNILCRASTNAANTGFLLWFDNSGYLKCELDVGNSGGVLDTGLEYNFKQGEWNHIAVTRASGAAKLFVNGIVRAQIASNSTNISGNGDLIIGSDINHTAYFYKGFISNLRVIKGSAEYTSSASNGEFGFDPPTAPLEDVTNTKLLCCNSSDSGYSATVGVVPIPQINDGTEWSTKLSLASGGFSQPAAYAFNGSLDPGWRLMTVNNAVLATFNNISIPCNVVEVFGENNYNSTCTVTISGTTYTSSSGSIHRFVQSGTLTAITLVNNGAGGRTYWEGVKVDGVILEDKTTKNFACVGVESEVAGSCTLAMPMAGNANWGNWWSTEDQCNYINPEAIPSTMMRDGAAKAWPGNSMYYGTAYNFDGSGDHIKSQTSSTDLQWGYGDFTIEAWVYPEANDADTYWRRIYLSDQSTQNANNNVQLGLVPTDGTAHAWTGGTNNGTGSNWNLDIRGKTKITQNTWHHVAVCRKDGLVTLYVNGQNEGSDNNWMNFNPEGAYGASYNFKAQAYIGTYNGSEGDFYGRIQDVRAYKGVAKYQKNFVVGSTIPDVCAAATYIPDSETSDENPIHTATTGSVAFDGSNDNISFGSQENFRMGTGDFTVEGWFYPSGKGVIDGNGVNDGIWQLVNSSNGYGGSSGSMSQQWEMTSSNIRVNNMMDGDPWYNLGKEQGFNATAGDKWYHVALSRTGDKVTSWLDGRENGTFTNGSNMNGGWFGLGAYWSTSQRFDGLLSNFRVIKGAGLYDHNFTPSTKALTTQPGSVNEAGTVWSDYCTAVPSGWHGPSPITNWFDGDSTTSANHNASNDTITFSPPTPLSGLLRICGWSSGYTVLVNGKDTGIELPSGNTSNQHWIEVGSFDNITEIKFTGTGGWYGTKISLNGELLLNPNFATTKTTLLCANDSENPMVADMPSNAAETNYTVTANGAIASTDNPWGTETDGSVFFDGNNDYLSLGSYNNFAFGTQDFTIELWLKSKMDTGTYQNFLATRGAPGTTAGWTFSIEQNGTIGFYSNGHQFNAAGSVKANVWTHIAVRRDAGVLRCYQDGKQIASNGSNQDYTQNTLTVGIHNDANGDGWYSGWISNVRITKGTARPLGEEGSFGRPGKAYTIGGSVIVFAQSPTNVSQVLNKEPIDIVAVGKPKAVTFNPFDNNTPAPGKYATLNQLDSPRLGTGTIGGKDNLYLFGDDYVYAKSDLWLGRTNATTGKYYWEVEAVFDQEGVSLGSEMTPYAGLTSNLEQDGGEIVSATDKCWFGGGGPVNGGPYLCRWDDSGSTNMSMWGNMGYTCFGFALDLDSRHMSFYLDGKPVGGDDAIPDPKTTYLIPFIAATNSGGANDWCDTIFNFGQKPWRYAPPVGYKGLSYQNVHNTTIDPSKYFNVQTYSGNQVVERLMPMSFEPGLTWIKRTDANGDWVNQSSVLGWGTHWFQNTGQELNTTTNYPYVASVNSSGVKLWGTATSGGNVSGRDYVMYSWKGGHPENETQYNGGIVVSNNPGSGYLQLDDSADWDIGGGDFTVECWYYPRSQGSYEGLVHQWENNNWNATNSWCLEPVGGSLDFYYAKTDGTIDHATGPTTTIPLNQWNHCAAVKSGNTIRVYLNGVYNGDHTVSGTIQNGNGKVRIGGGCANGGNVDGMISNVRVVKGTAVYWANFTPSFLPLTNVTNTKLLCCQSLNDFTAGRVKPGSITAVGNAKQMNVSGPCMRFCKDGTCYSSMSAISNSGDHARVFQATVNTTSGFGMYHWRQDSGGSSKSIPHGFNQKPDFVVMKHTNNSSECMVHHSSISSPAKILYFTDDKSEDNSSDFGSTYPDDSVIYTNTTGVNGREVVICAWHNVEGLQKFGQFYGTTDNDGAYVHLGFRPAVVVVKRLNADGNWGVSDDAQNLWNKEWGSDVTVLLDLLNPSFTSASLNVDLLSGGFKLRSDNNEWNAASNRYAYCAWARSGPFGSLGR